MENFKKDIEKGRGEVIRVEVSEFKGKKLLNLRIWYTDPASEELKPTKKGIAIPEELLDDVKAAFLEADQILRSAGE